MLRTGKRCSGEATTVGEFHSGAPVRPFLARGEAIVLAAITALGLALRFTKLGAQSFWEDETVTADIVRSSFHTLMLRVRALDSNPPLYHLTAWFWSKAAGVSEIGLRSPSAVLGTAVIPVSYLAARTLATPRAAVVAALLTALSPLLVWYSQEARPYEMLAFFGALSFLFFARTITRYRARDLAGWGISSALALATHYFAFFLLFVEAVVLIRHVPRRRNLILALAPVAAVGVALLPFLRVQFHVASFQGAQSIGFRLRQLGNWFTTGDLRETAPLVVAVLATILGIWLLARRVDGEPAPGGRIAFGVGLATIALPLLLVAFGFDVFLFRNVIEAWVPLAIGLGVGFTRPGWGWLGIPGAAALCTTFALSDIATFVEPRLQRDDWRSVATIVAQSGRATAVVVYPQWDARAMLHYLPSAGVATGRVVRVRSVWFVGVEEPYAGGRSSWPSPSRVRLNVPTGFRQVSERQVQHFVLRHFTSARPRRISVSPLEASAETGEALRVLVE